MFTPFTNQNFQRVAFFVYQDGMDLWSLEAHCKFWQWIYFHTSTENHFQENVILNTIKHSEFFHVHTIHIILVKGVGVLVLFFNTVDVHHPMEFRISTDVFTEQMFHICYSWHSGVYLKTGCELQPMNTVDHVITKQNFTQSHNIFLDKRRLFHPTEVSEGMPSKFIMIKSHFTKQSHIYVWISK